MCCRAVCRGLAGGVRHLSGRQDEEQVDTLPGSRWQPPLITVTFAAQLWSLSLPTGVYPGRGQFPLVGRS